MISQSLVTVAASACSTSGPELPSISSPLVDVDRAVQVGVSIARSLSATACVPVIIIDLPETHIVGSTVSVLVNCVRISSTLVAHDAFAVGLIPGILRAPSSDIDILRG